MQLVVQQKVFEGALKMSHYQIKNNKKNLRSKRKIWQTKRIQYLKILKKETKTSKKNYKLKSKKNKIKKYKKSKKHKIVY